MAKKIKKLDTDSLDKSSLFVCAKCGETSYESLGSLPAAECSEFGDDGNELILIERERVRCFGCEQQAMIIRRTYR